MIKSKSEMKRIATVSPEKAANELDRLKKNLDVAIEALNRIGMLGLSEYAYTSYFTDRTRHIVTETLGKLSAKPE